MENAEEIKESLVFEAVMKQYSTLREEILTWTKSETTTIKILFSINSLIFTFVQTSQKYSLLLVIPPITFFGTWLWISDHCMIRTISAYISKEIEKKRIPQIIGGMDNESLWIGWDTFVINLPRQLQERGADRTTIIVALLWLNTVLSVFLIYYYTESLCKEYHIILLAVLYLHVMIGITIYIIYLSRKRYEIDSSFASGQIKFK
jgi:hypothetical protein